MYTTSTEPVQKEVEPISEKQQKALPKEMPHEKETKKHIDLNWANSFIEKHKLFLSKEKGVKKDYLKQWALQQGFPKEDTEEIADLVTLSKDKVIALIIIIFFWFFNLILKQ